MDHSVLNINGCQLRAVTLNDYAFVQSLFDVQDIKKYYVLRDDHAANIRAFVQYMIAANQQNAALDYIIVNEYGTSVGLITAELIRHNGEIIWNVGYAVHPSYRHQGYASRALNGLANYLQNTFSIQISLDISDDNKTSEAVAKKCGFAKPTGGPRIGYFDFDHQDVGMRFKWFKQASGRIAIFNQAMQLARAKDYVTAIQYYKKAMEEPYIPGTPHTDEQIYSNMGMCYSSIRLYQTAYDCLMRAKRGGLTNANIEKELLWLRNNAGIY